MNGFISKCLTKSYRFTCVSLHLTSLQLVDGQFGGGHRSLYEINFGGNVPVSDGPSYIRPGLRVLSIVLVIFFCFEISFLSYKPTFRSAYMFYRRRRTFLSSYWFHFCWHIDTRRNRQDEFVLYSIASSTCTCIESKGKMVNQSEIRIFGFTSHVPIGESFCPEFVTLIKYSIVCHSLPVFEWFGKSFGLQSNPNERDKTKREINEREAYHLETIKLKWENLKITASGHPCVKPKLIKNG